MNIYNILSNTTQLMVIIKRCILHYYFQLHVSAPSFGAIFRLNYFSVKKAMYTFDNTVIDLRSLITYLKY